jgi:hypothetical protein
MGLTQQIEYADAKVTLPPAVKKHLWDGKKFVPITLYKHNGVPNHLEIRWLHKTYGSPGTYRNGQYWDYSLAGNFTVMEEKVYTWYQMKWGNK